MRVPTGSHKGRRGRRPLRIFSRRSVGAGFPRPPAASLRQSLPLRGRWLRRRRRRKGADGWSEELRQPAINAPSLQIPERDDHTAVWAPSVSLRSTAPPEGEPIKKGYFQSRFARQLPQRGSLFLISASLDSSPYTGEPFLDFNCALLFHTGAVRNTSVGAIHESPAF